MFAGVVIAFLNPQLFEKFIEGAAELYGEGNLLDKSSAQISWSILQQNSVAYLFMIVLGGVTLGLAAVFLLLLNAAILGLVFGFTAAGVTGPEFGWAETLALILPHALVEVPALLLGSTLGLRLGVDWLLPSAKGDRWQVWRSRLHDVGVITPLAILLITIAALIEGFVTPRIALLFLG